MSGGDSFPALDDFAPALGGFEVWDKTIKAPAGKEKVVAYVSIGFTGTVSLNRGAGKMAGWPFAVRLAFDPERRRLAIIPASREDERAHGLGDYQASIGCKGFLDYYGIGYAETTKYHGLSLADGVLIVDLNDPGEAA